jgi:hypothetical protein
VRDRVVIVPAALLVAGIYAWPWLLLLWTQLFAPRDHAAIFDWLHEPLLLLWGLLFTLSLVIGFLAIALARPGKPFLVAMVLGALLGLALLHGTRYGFTQYSTRWTRWWDYGLFLMAPVGSMAGASLTVLMQRRLLSNQRLERP